MTTYKVLPGDSLSKISQMFFGDFSMVNAIAQANGITNINLIYPGQTLTIPAITTAINKSNHVQDAEILTDEDEDGKGKAWLYGMVIVGLVGVGGYYYYKKIKPKGKSK
jgi:hypothetical protein